jgi:hypothetical protein
MARYSPTLGPRGLQCRESVRKNRDYIDRDTGGTGRCGYCRPCWRLFVWQCRQLGLPLPKLRPEHGRIGFANFRFMKAGK